MTINGTVHRIGFLLFLVTAGALWAWTHNHILSPRSLLLVLLSGSLMAIALVWVTVRKKHWSPVTGPSYSLLEGLVIGGLSARLDLRYPGIAIQAVALTFTICFCMLIAYRTGLIRVTEKFNGGLMVATAGVALFYMGSFVLALLGERTVTAFATGMAGILISVIVVMIASMNLVSDFDFIDQCGKSRLPKHMEWYTSFGIVLTLVWLYLETLRLLSKARKAEELA